MKDSFYEELEHVLGKFPKCQKKILLGDFSAKVGKEEIFKQAIGNEILHKISNYNRVKLVDFLTFKNLTVSITMFPNQNINKLGCLQMGKSTI
jgi:hypothetical protein